MIRATLSSLLAVALVCGPVAGAAQSGGRPLDVYFVDVEGGQATLFVSPPASQCSSMPGMRASMTGTPIASSRWLARPDSARSTTSW